MVNALVEINENTKRVLNVVKAKYGLKDKSEAIEFVINRYIEEEEPELRYEFLEIIRAIDKQKSIPVDDFAKRYGLN